MNEFNLYGLYIPWLLVLFCVALGLTKVLSTALARFGLYRLVWHPALFDVALFFIVLGGLNFLFPNLLS